ncbi:acetyl-CoA synthetase-like protein [Lasiosphaeria hispida]|uniref:Acetyl-CoA synthetase-like protein n=1 Tax=Lasiosphaeria hispida TaxID=260671 RepID=A0AAJ0HXE1_9PEZI|nr:acetyl-CoA synthetase-like protein [Lasiosphaeria hispida]
MSIAKTNGLAYSGGPPGHLPRCSTYEWSLSQPFESQNDFTPAAHRVPRIEDSRPIFVDNQTDRTLTHGRIAADSLRIASALQHLGLSPTDITKLPPTPSCPAGPEVAPVVLLQLPNSLAFSPLLLGVFAANLTATLVSPALTAPEISWILQNAWPRVIITAKPCLGAMREAIAAQEDRGYFDGVPVLVVDVGADTYPAPWTAAPSGERCWRELLAAEPRARPVFDPDSAKTRTAVILWSSGTSGRSKGVLLSHHAINFSIACVWHDADYYPGQERQRWLGYVPFYHVFGLCNVLLLAFCAGATVFVMPTFSLDGMLAAIPKREITYLHMAPPIGVMLAKAPIVEKYAKRDLLTGRNAFSSVVSAVTGGAPLGHEVVVEVYKRCGFRVRLGYGLSETCCTSMQRGIGEEEMNAQAGETGLPHWGVELMIVSMDGELKPAKVDEEGEILVRAPSIMTAYLPVGVFTGAKMDMLATIEAVTSDGWFRTGDVGALNVQGRLRITDRLKELIKVRAYQVAPAELEAVLCSSEAVADAGVVGVYDKFEATEWPRAFVVPRQAGKTRAELEALAAELKVLVEKRTAKYKWLVGGIIFVDQIPKSPSGKILRRLLKDGGKGTQGVEVVLYQPKRRAPKL